jgi:hypothetical protein
MSLAAFPAAVLETILPRLALLFLTGARGDMEAARQATRQMLTAYHPETEEELCLAAHIVGFSFQALGRGAGPDTPVNRMLRLRSGAVSLSREANKAERRLTQLQKARKQAPAETRLESAPQSPKIAVALVPVPTAKPSSPTWTQSYDDRQRELRIAASLKRAEARMAAQITAATPAHQTPAMAT